MVMRAVLAVKDMFLMAGNSQVKTLLFMWKGDGSPLRYKVNIFGLISRTNQCHWEMTEQNIESQFVVNHLDNLSFKISKETFIILDNASVYQSKLLRENLDRWQKKGLFIFFLPTYSPHLNIAETMWRKLKTEWLYPEDYLEKDSLFYAINRCMTNIGTNIKINFSDFNAN